MEEQRAPLLSDEDTPLPPEIVALFNVLTTEECGDRLIAAGVYRNGLEDGFREAWRMVEAKITNVELIVVKTATYDDQCSLCGNDVIEVGSPTFCPGCGAKIID